MCISVIDTYLTQMISLYVWYFWVQVAYLPKLFHNIPDDKFQENIEESVSTALGMYSREKECILFCEECGCSGQIR